MLKDLILKEWNFRTFKDKEDQCINNYGNKEKLKSKKGTGPYSLDL